MIQNQTTPSFKLILKGKDSIVGRFKQPTITIKPLHLNGKRIELKFTTIATIQREDGLGWMCSRKPNIFCFQLEDGTRLTGTPVGKKITVDTSHFKQLDVKFEHILKVEKV